MGEIISRGWGRLAVLAALAAIWGCADGGAPEIGRSTLPIIECNAQTVGQPCDTDDSVCTVETCVEQGQGVVCMAVGPAPDGTACESDGEPCTVDVCEAGVCGHDPLPAGTLCDDGMYCTVADVCDEAGVCAGDERSCDDGNGCTLDSCDEMGERCDNVPDVGASCDDDDACTEDTTCDESGACTGTAVTCSDGNECTVDACDPETGCTFPGDEGAPCSDEAFCSTGETCSADGTCDSVPTCLDGDPCTADSCDEQGDACVFEPLVGASCDDRNPCTNEDLCTADGCAGDVVPDGTVCDDAGGCLVGGVCEDGQCVQAVPEPDGTLCDDGDACTYSDVCVDGGCGGMPIVCYDDDPCTADGCDPVLGCVHEPIEGCDGSSPGDAGVPDAGPAADSGATGEDEVPFDGRLGGGGCGCDSGGGQGGALWALLFAAALWRRRRRAAVGLALVAAVAVSPLARAQGFDAQLYSPASQSTGYLGVDGADVAPSGVLDVGLSFDVATDVLVFRDPDTGDVIEDADVLARRAGGALRAGFGIAGLAELSLLLPFDLDQSGDLMHVSPDSELGGGVGDLRVGGKLGLVRRGPLRLAVGAELGLPTGDTARFSGEDGVTTTPQVYAGVRQGPVRADLAVGYRVRPRAEVAGLVIDDEVTLGAGVGVEAMRDRLWLLGEASAAVGVRGDAAAEKVPVEVRAGGRLAVSGPWTLSLGVGMGVSHGYGTPAVRGLAVFAYAPRPAVDAMPVAIAAPAPPDADEDGVADARDLCPTVAGTGESGCPDAPADGDRLADLDDPCIPLLERVSGIDYGDGCTGPELATWVEDRIVLEERVLFDTMRARVKHAGRPVLRSIVELWARHPEWERMVIEGHADARGTDEYNEWLSAKRARRVREALIELGMPPEKIETIARGESVPRVEGTSEEALQKNRRVEFVIVDEKQVPVSELPADDEPAPSE